MEDLVASVRAIYLTADEFQTEHNFSVRVVSPHGQQLIPRSWGFVADENIDNFFQLLARLLSAGFLVSLDHRADRFKDGRVVMLTFDVDSKDSKKEPDLPRVLSFFHDALGGVLRGADASLGFSRHVLLTQNISKPGSLHFYYYNIYAPLPAIRIAVRAVKDMIGDKLEECGLKLDAQPYVMGVLRYPHTYAFKSFPGQPDSRHVELGFFKGLKKLSHEEIQRNSPFVNCFDVDHNLVDGRLALFWALLHAAPQHRYVPIAPVKAARAAALEPGPPLPPSSEPAPYDPLSNIDRSLAKKVDMMDNTVYFDWAVFREIAPKYGASQETYNYLAERVVLIDMTFHFKTRGQQQTMTVYEVTHNTILGSAWNVNVHVPAGKLQKNGKRRLIQQSVWTWFKSVVECHSHAACCPRYPGRPSKEMDHVFNTWNGFVGYQYVIQPDFERVSLGDLCADRDLQFFMWFLHQVICNKSSAVFYRLLAWLRSVFMEPDLPVGVVPLIIGAGGVGKSLLFNFLRNHVFGVQHSAVVQSLDLLTQRFNGFSMRLSVCFVDESNAFTNHTLSTMKFVTTNPGGRQVERKGKEVSFNGPPLSLFLASNDTKMALEMHERRFLAFGCDDGYGNFQRTGHPEREAAVMAWQTMLNDTQRAQHLAGVLLCLLVRFFDMSQFNATRSEPLMTPIYVAMRKHGLSHFEQFWDECLSDYCNIRSNHPFDGSVATKIVREGDGSWALYVPFEGIKLHWYDFNTMNRSGRGRLATLRDNLVAIAGAKFETKQGTLWATIPRHKRCAELFANHIKLTVDEDTLKYEDHSGAWVKGASGRLEPTDEALFFACFSFFVQPTRAPSSPSLLSSDENSLDTDSIFQSAGSSSGSSSLSDLAGFEY